MVFLENENFLARKGIFIVETGKVSVIVPVYNVEKYLPQCLDSLINQTYSNLEIICVNDGSTDESLKILESYAKKDSRIVILDKENGGLSSARNAGLEAATGDYIGFVDSDDWCDLTMFEKLVTLSMNTQSDFVFCGLATYNEEKKRVNKPSSFFSLSTFTDEDQGRKLSKEKLISSQYFFGHFVCNRLFRREFIDKNKLEFREGILYEDGYFSIDTAFCIDTFSFTKERLYYYRRKRSGAITNQKNQGREDRIQFLEYLYLKTRAAGLLDEEEVRFWEYAFSVLDGLLAEDIYELIRRFVLTYSISQKAMDSSFILQEKRRVYESCSSYGELLRKEETLRWYMPMISRRVKSECIEYCLFGFCISRVSLRKPN